MRFTIAAVVVLLVALALGSAVSWVSVRETRGFGAMNIGVWTAWPKAGSAQADPYTNARVAADGEVPLGAAEGIVFTARTDSTGAPLEARCNYRLIGQVPPARFWSIIAATPDGKVLSDALGEPAELLSESVLWNDDGGIEVHVGDVAEAGNWLPLRDGSLFQLVLTLYDSQITSGSSVVSPVLPSIERQACSG